MTDDRDGGDIPPIPEPAPPPPLATEAPPAAPAVPQPPAAPASPPLAPPQAPAPPPSAATGRTGFWAAMIVLAFGAGVGLTLLVLWLSGSLGDSRQRFDVTSPTSNYGSGPSSFGGSGSTPAPPGTSDGSAPTVLSIAGTWGPNCPGSRTDAATFYGDGTMVADRDSGTWSLSGNDMTVQLGRETTMLRWEMLTNDSARLTRTGGRSRIVYRCT